MKRFSTASLLFLFLIGSVACSARPQVPVGTIPEVAKPDAQHVQHTAYAIAGQAQQKGHVRLTSGKEYQRVRKIYDRLAKGIGVSSDTWPLFVYDGYDVINASAVNQNTMVVYTGLIRRMRDDAQLAAIIGHEMGHLLAKHANDKERGSKVTTTKVLGNILGTAAAIGGAAAGLGSSGAELAGKLTYAGTATVGKGVILSFDRDQEYEADHIGMMIMAKGGYNPEAAIEVWAKSEEIFGQANTSNFLSTHPSDKNRSKHLKEALPKAMEFYEQAKGKKAAK